MGEGSVAEETRGRTEGERRPGPPLPLCPRRACKWGAVAARSPRQSEVLATVLQIAQAGLQPLGEVRVRVRLRLCLQLGQGHRRAQSALFGG